MTTRALRRDAADNRRRLVHAASTVFSEQGLEGGVEEIARLAGLGVGTLYRHFPTKDALIAELVTELLSETIAVLEQSCDEPVGLGLERALWRVCEVQAANRGCQQRLWARLVKNEQIDRARALVGRLLTEAQHHGEIRAEVTLEDIAFIFLTLSMVIEQTAPLVPDAWRRCLEVIIAGLRPAGGVLTSPTLSRAELRAIQAARALS